VVSRAQLLALGVPASSLAEWAKRDRLHRVHRGVYAVGHLSLTRNGRFMAAVLACGEGAAPSHVSAAVLWGMLEDRGQAIHVTSPTRRRVRGIVVHCAPLDGERVKRDGIVATTPARTVVDLADVVTSRRTLERALDEASYLRLDLTGLAARGGRRGSGLLSSVLVVHHPGSTRTRSELEELFLALIDRARLPRPEVNTHLEGFECDFVFRDERLVVETDGGAAHGTQRAKERDPMRDARLMATGWRVWRVSHVLVFRRPDQVAAELEELLTPPVPSPAGALASRRSP
jgi:very-short-patch-repair endonuclease